MKKSELKQMIKEEISSVLNNTPSREELFKSFQREAEKIAKDINMPLEIIYLGDLMRFIVDVEYNNWLNLLYGISIRRVNPSQNSIKKATKEFNYWKDNIKQNWENYLSLKEKGEEEIERYVKEKMKKAGWDWD